ncbi:leucine-rich repeat flightless-interacting protein 1 isoform X4 [Bufo gargarizans]|uniref:leucine-rich repeat flightless-interacting protein 1 isoform X4 n=1 Tax=Bufo gargarizans TaxID=30331 RepID=UPI001CF1F971|nr:leucine-rich repeat flightless-interacting protein 1 isoform X4 [Bufo gargarizans]
MGTQGPGRKRHPNKEKLSAEDHALNQIAREAEARLAAKRAARAEAREIRMKELERQQKEIYQVQKKYYGLDTKWGDIEQWMEDSERYSHRPRRNLQVSEDDAMSVSSRSSLRTNGYEDELLGATQYRKSSRSSSGSGDATQSSRGPPRDEAMSAYYSDPSLASAPHTAKSQQQTVHNGSRPSLLNCNSLPSRSQRGSLYDEGVPSSSRRSSSSRPPSEYSCYVGSGSRASSRASSARASPVSSEPTGPLLFRRGSSSGSVHSQVHLEDVSVPSVSRVEERSDKDFAEKSGRPVSSLSAATLASLGGTSSRRGSGDTSISVDTEASIREIKDSLAEVEEKYKRSMVTNAQLDNEKTSFQYQVDTLREVLLELEEELAESRRQYEDKQKECERQKHEQGVLRFQLAEMKEALEQREALMMEIRQLQQKQEINDREICDLKETIEWKDKKIGALERQKEFFDPVRTERDALREEVTHLREVLKKHGIVLDSDGTLNGDSSMEHHVNSDGPPDPPVRAVSMGKTEGTMEKKETLSVVGECPPSGTEQDRQETAQDAQKEIPMHAEDEDVTRDHAKKENNTIVETQSVDECSHLKSETSINEQKEEMSCDIKENKQETSQTDILENLSEVDGETTLEKSDVSPSGSEVFQDAIDFVDETSSSSNELNDDITGCESDGKKEEPENSQQENISEVDDQCSLDGAPKEGDEVPNENAVNVHKTEEDEVIEGKQDSSKESISDEESSTELSASSKDGDLGHEVPIEDQIEPQQSEHEESGSQTTEGENKQDERLSAAYSDDIDQGKNISSSEHPPQDALLKSNDLVAQVESNNDKTLDVSESCTVTESNSITKDEPIKDHVIPDMSSSPAEQEHVPLDERQRDVSSESEDLKEVDQKEEDTLSDDIVCDNTQNADDSVANEAESPPKIAPPEVFGSEGESTQEGEETDDDNDDDNGTMQSEKYTGESEIPCTSLGSSVDRQSLEDIRMDDASEKSPKKGKGKNKDDCVVS